MSLPSIPEHLKICHKKGQPTSYSATSYARHYNCAEFYMIPYHSTKTRFCAPDLGCPSCSAHSPILQASPSPP